MESGQGWLQGGGDGGDASPIPPACNFTLFCIVDLYDKCHFAREYYVPLTIFTSYPPPKFSGAIPESG